MKGMNIKKYLFIIAVCAIIAIIAYSSGSNKSTTNAAYRTEMNGSDSARVAKWDINSLDKNGQEMSLSADVQNIESGSGNWFLEIENLSEVAAKINGSLSTIGIKLDSGIFSLKSYGSDVSWNFIDGETNPIRFVVYVYDCPVSEVLSYNMKQGGVTTNISYEQYLALSESEKKACTEYVDESVSKITIFDTASTSNPMELDQKDDPNNDDIKYLYQEFTLNSTNLNFGINENTRKCLRIYWEIDDSIGSTTGTVDKFTIYDNETGAVIDDNVDLFDYQKYISGLKGEPIYELMVGDELDLIRHQDLTDEQEAFLANPKVGGVNKTGKELYQHLTYLMYENFKTKQAEYLSTLGYLECGLSCSIIFNVKVEQVD